MTDKVKIIPQFLDHDEQEVKLLTVFQAGLVLNSWHREFLL